MIQAGISGGFVGVITELATQSTQFQAVVESLNSLMQILADSLGTLIAPLQPLIAAVGIVVRAVVDSLTPVFKLIAAIIKPLVPPIVALGIILEGLAPLIAMVAKMFLVITAPLLLLTGPIMQGLFWALKTFGTLVLRVVIFVENIWNAIVGGIQSVIRMFEGIPIIGGAMGKLADKLDKLKANVLDTGSALADLEEMSWDSAMAKAAETEAVEDGTDAKKDETKASEGAAKAAREVAQSFFNIPEGYKVAAAQFAAMAAQFNKWVAPTSKSQLSALGTPDLLATIPHFATGGIVTGPTLALIGEAGPEAVVPLGGGRSGGGGTFNVTIMSNDPAEVWRKLKRMMETESFHNTGSIIAGAPRFSGG